jgi:hypothetical protein
VVVSTKITDISEPSPAQYKAADGPTMAEKIAALKERQSCAHGVDFRSYCGKCEAAARYDASRHISEWGVNIAPGTWEEALDRVLAEMREVMVERHNKYGPSNISEQGLYGVITRSGDKFSRIRNSLTGRIVGGRIVLDPIPGGEASDTFEDGLIDCSNYIGPIALMVHRGWWTLPRE